MMALNRHRLKHLAGQGVLGAKTTQGLLTRTDLLLSVILIGNNLFNTIIPVLTTSLALHTFGRNNLALSIATGIVAFLIIVFAEIAPKIVGATFPERIALPASLVIAPLMRVFKPIVWFVNALANGVLWVLRINTKKGRDQRMSADELRAIVLESSSFMPTKHRSILLNLFDLENITVDDVMVPRRQIESLNFYAPLDDILHQLETCYHNRWSSMKATSTRCSACCTCARRSPRCTTRISTAKRCARCSPSRTTCRRARRSSSSCSISRKAGSAPRSSSTSTASSRGSSRPRTSSRN